MAKTINDNEVIINPSSDELVQSFVLTISNRNWSVTGERILSFLVAIAQADIKGIDFSDSSNFRQHQPSFNYPFIEQNPSGDMTVNIPIKFLIPENSKNYTAIREAVEFLQKKIIRFDGFKTLDDGTLALNENGEPIKVWTSVQFLGEANIIDYPYSTLTITVNRSIWNMMLDFRLGFTAYSPNVLKRLSSRYAIRFYTLMARQRNSIVYPLSQLKKMFGLNEKYSIPSQFIERVLVPAKTELDSISPYSFEFEPVYASTSSGRGRKPITKIKFTPVHILKNESLIRQAPSKTMAASCLLPKRLIKLLQDRFEFSGDDLANFADILELAKKMMGDKELYIFVSKLTNYFKKTMDRKKYLYGAIKNHLRETYDIVYKSESLLEFEKNFLTQISKYKTKDGLDMTMFNEEQE